MEELREETENEKKTKEKVVGRRMRWQGHGQRTGSEIAKKSMQMQMGMVDDEVDKGSHRLPSPKPDQGEDEASEII